MRFVQTRAEMKIRETILPLLSDLVSQSCCIDEGVLDRPDIVAITDSNERIGIEVTRLAYEKFMKWLAKGTPIGSRREARVFVNLEKQIGTALKQKNKKYLEYKRSRHLKEVWLCLHNDLYEFNAGEKTGQLDPAWFFNEAWRICRKFECKFDRVLFFSENARQYLPVYEKRNRSYFPRPSTTIPVIEFVEMVGKMTSSGLNFDDSYVVADNKTFGLA